MHRSMRCKCSTVAPPGAVRHKGQHSRHIERVRHATRRGGWSVVTDLQQSVSFARVILLRADLDMQHTGMSLVCDTSVTTAALDGAGHGHHGDDSRGNLGNNAR